jgi:hypothetical protein
MRIILSVRRSVHFAIADLHKLTTFDKLSDHREQEQSLRKFMHDVVEERIHSRLRLFRIKRAQQYFMVRRVTQCLVSEQKSDDKEY